MPAILAFLFIYFVSLMCLFITVQSRKERLAQYLNDLNMPADTAPSQAAPISCPASAQLFAPSPESRGIHSLHLSSCCLLLPAKCLVFRFQDELLLGSLRDLLQLKGPALQNARESPWRLYLRNTQSRFRRSQKRPKYVALR
jgi:hypothetical protein